MTLEEKHELLASLFDETALFESKVLNIRTDTDRAEVIRLIANTLVNDKLAASLHFSHLKSYNNLSTKGIVPAMLKLVITEMANFLQEELRFSAGMTKEVVANTQHLRFMKHLCNTYYLGHRTVMLEMIADSLFEKIAALASPSRSSKLLIEAVEGNDKRDSLMVLDGGTKVVLNLEQAWKHVHRAYLARKRETSGIQMALSKLLMSLEELDEDAENEKKELLARCGKKEQELKQVRKKPLDKYDATLKRMKQAVEQRLASKDFSRPA